MNNTRCKVIRTIGNGRKAVKRTMLIAKYPKCLKYLSERAERERDAGNRADELPFYDTVFVRTAKGKNVYRLDIEEC